MSDRVTPTENTETMYAGAPDSWSAYHKNIEPSDATELVPAPRVVCVRVFGTVTVKNIRGESVVHKDMSPGEYINGPITYLMETGTTNVGDATDYVAYYG